MPSLIDGKKIADLVALDGLPRVVLDDEGTQHVLYLPDGAPLPHSMLASDWPPPLPTEPTPEESAAAIQAREAKQKEAHDKAALKRQRMIDLAESAVGEGIDRLSAKQLGAILALLHPEIVDDALAVRPLEEWTRG